MFRWLKCLGARSANPDEPSLRFLGYALPRTQGDTSPYVLTRDQMELHDVPLGSSQSFLDFNGVITFAGAFEKVEQSVWPSEPPSLKCRSLPDLDLRERQLDTMLQRDEPIVFLVPQILESLGYGSVDPRIDLFRRFLASRGIAWTCRETPHTSLTSAIPEFRDFVEHYGAGYITYKFSGSGPHITRTVCKGPSGVLGFVISDTIFVLPAVFPGTHKQAVDMALSAVRGVVAYRQRISKTLPGWISQLQFGKEKELAEQAISLRNELAEIEARTGAYTRYKGSLCYRSEPLVQITSHLLRDFLDIDLVIDEKYIEDATVQGDDGETVAVVEIKGVKHCCPVISRTMATGYATRLS